MKKKVLCVEDSDIIRELMRLLFENAGFEFYEACDGIEGLEKIDIVQPDIVVTDMMMPRMDGVELITSVRNRLKYTELPILVVSSEKECGVQLRAQNAGSNGWVDKSSMRAEVVNFARRLISTRFDAPLRHVS